MSVDNISTTDKGRVIIIDFRKDPFRSSPWIMNHVRGNKAEVIATALS